MDPFIWSFFEPACPGSASSGGRFDINIIDYLSHWIIFRQLIYPDYERGKRYGVFAAGINPICWTIASQGDVGKGFGLHSPLI